LVLYIYVRLLETVGGVLTGQLANSFMATGETNADARFF